MHGQKNIKIPYQCFETNYQSHQGSRLQKELGGRGWKRLEETLLLSPTTTLFQRTHTENTLTHSRLISRHDIFLNRLKQGNAERRQKVLVYPDRISE